MCAAFYGAIETVKFLIQNGANVNLQSPDDLMTALHFSVGRGSNNLMVRIPPRLEKQSERRTPPFPDQVSALLLQSGANPGLRDALGRSASDILAMTQGGASVGAPQHRVEPTPAWLPVTPSSLSSLQTRCP